MNGTLDRLIEEGLCALAAARLPVYAQAPCVPNLRGKGDPNATIPRIVFKCESQETPELYKAGVFMVETEAQVIVEGSGDDQARQLDGMNRTVDDLFASPDLCSLLITSRLMVYGSVIGGEAQEQEDNRLIRRRSITIHAKLR